MRKAVLIIFSILGILILNGASFFILNGKINNLKEKLEDDRGKLEERVGIIERKGKKDIDLINKTDKTFTTNKSDMSDKTNDQEGVGGIVGGERKEETGGTVCQDSCQSQIDLLKKILPTPTSVVKKDLVKEIYVPLGSGTYKGSAYKTVSAFAYIDLSNFGKIKEAYFEAILRVPTANGSVYARLVDVTDSNTPVAGAEIFTNSTEPVLVNSGKIGLAYGGKKLYSVQLRTTMDFEGVLDLARVRIIIE